MQLALFSWRQFLIHVWFAMWPQAGTHKARRAWQRNLLHCKLRGEPQKARIVLTASAVDDTLIIDEDHAEVAAGDLDKDEGLPVQE